MLIDLNSLAAVQTNPTIETAKKTTQLLNYSVTHPDAITEYRKSGMIIHIYYDASYISEPEAQIRDGEYFFLEQKFKTTIQEMSQKNGPVNVECSIMRNVKA